MGQLNFKYCRALVIAPRFDIAFVVEQILQSFWLRGRYNLDALERELWTPLVRRRTRSACPGSRRS